MNSVIQDVDRPDVDGVAPKMQAICDKIREELVTLPYVSVSTNDNLMSSVYVRGTFDPKENWTNGIFQNGLYFVISICPEKGKRYYTEGEKITVELGSCSYLLGETKMRKYTGPVEKVIEKINKWFVLNQNLLHISM